MDDEEFAEVLDMLGEYFKTVPHKKTKTQEAYQLPSGKLILKKQEPEPTVQKKTTKAKKGKKRRRGGRR